MRVQRRALLHGEIAVRPRVQAIDDRLTTAWSALSGGQTGDAAATAIADAAHALQDRLTDAATTVDGLAADLQGVQARAADTIGSIQTILLVAAVALTLFFIWVFILNLALWQLGRTWGREASSAAAGQAPDAGPAVEPA